MAVQRLSPVNTWRQSGRVSLWRYTENERNYPGWNLNADAAGCRSLLELLDALTITGAGGRMVTVTQPTSEQLRVPNNRGGAAAWLAPENGTSRSHPIPPPGIFLQARNLPCWRSARTGLRH